MTSDLPTIHCSTAAGVAKGRRYGWQSWLVSGVFHIVVLAALASDFLWESTIFPPTAGMAGAGAALQSSFDAFDTVLLAHESRLAASFQLTSPLVEPSKSSDAAAQLAGQVSAGLNSLATAAGSRSADENRAELDRLGKRLGAVSSEQSVDEMAAKFQQWLGTDRRAAKPSATPVEGDFDFTTAQVHEIRRVRGHDGEWLYSSVLVDAAGRTFEAPMEEAEGQSAYETMEIVKKNPLMELVYRKIAMSLLDDLIKSGQQLEQARQEVEAAQPR